MDLQDSSIDTEQLAYADAVRQRRVDRRRELWRWLMSKATGREVLYELVLGELGYLRHIGGPLEQVYGEAALHNLCCRLMAEDILPHRELFMQMQAEALKRDEDERKELEAARAKWAKDRAERGES